MIGELRYILVTDGSSDVVLLPILDWILQTQGARQAIQGEWADLRRARWPGKPTLADKVSAALQHNSCDILFVHRDAEKKSRTNRVEEISSGIEVVKLSQPVSPAVCVIPVRMQEAWLLFDETAIKHAAGNRNYRESLDLPPIRQLEALPDPKAVLHDRLKRASGLSGRRLRNYPARQRAVRVTEFINDFSPLRALPAFTALEDDVRRVLQKFAWVS